LDRCADDATTSAFREHEAMTVPDEAIFEVRVTKQAGDGFGVTMEGAGPSVSKRDIVVRAIELLVLHLENESGLGAWDEGVAEGLRRGSR
jgi:hypothetical protein